MVWLLYQNELINPFTVLNYGPRILVAPVVLRMPEPCMWSMYAKITQTSQHLKGNEWTEWQYHGAQTQLHKIQYHCFMIPHLQIWIHYPHFYLPRRTFMSSHPREHIHSADCYTQLVFLVALTGYLFKRASFLLMYLAHFLVLLWRICRKCSKQQVKMAILQDELQRRK